MPTEEIGQAFYFCPEGIVMGQICWVNVHNCNENVRMKPNRTSRNEREEFNGIKQMSNGSKASHWISD